MKNWGTTAVSGAEELDIADDNAESVTEFYFQKFLEKAQANDQVTLTLVRKIRKLEAGAMRTNSPKKVALYQDFLNRLQETVVDSRKASARECSRLAGKFNKLKVRSSASANCRTERELQLERQLLALEFEFKRLSN